MIEKATIDCYDDSEIFSGWACILEEKLIIPLKCFIYGEEAQLIGLDTGEMGVGVLAIVKKNKKKIRIPIQDLEVADKKAKGLEWLTAYKYWLKG